MTATSTRYAVATLVASLVAVSPALAQRLSYETNPFFVFDWDERLTAGVELADVDGDGDLDVLVANGRHWAQPDVVYYNTGNGRLTTARQLGDVHGPSYIVRAGDLDADGDMDAVIVGDGVPAKVFTNDGTGVFTLLGEIEGSDGPARNALLEDLNGDSALDLVTVQRRGGVRMFAGLGDGSFDAPYQMPGDLRGSTGIDMGDFNGDGRPDLAVACRDGGPSYLLMNLAGRGWTAEALAGSEGDHRQIVAGDFNGDRYADVILGAVDGGLHVLLGGSERRFTPGGSIDDAGPLPPSPEDLPIQALAAADLDGDGDLDFVAGLEEKNNRFYINDGAANFTVFTLEDEAEDTYGVAIGDMNSDGLPDLVFASSGAPNFVMLAGWMEPETDLP
ncbi:VCBS repeat-containing protein [Henriciella sp. AS95]|uniref:FG-GAP repeat domain-containing protein n=1 Tax=Henriciella sp. AS95 TaxID=3135782 RepID=UPI00316E31DC